MTATAGLTFPFQYGKAFADWTPVTSPAAGAVATYTIEGRWAIRVLAARSILTTDANAANRLHTIDFTDAKGTTLVRNGAGLVVTASTTAQAFEWSATRTVAEWAANTPVFAPLLPIIMPPGWKITFALDNVQATDQLFGLYLYVEKFPTDHDSYPVGAIPPGVEL